MGEDSFTYETVRKIKSFILFNNTSGLDTILHSSSIVRSYNMSQFFILVIRRIERLRYLHIVINHIKFRVDFNS